MKTEQQWLSEYGESHRHPLNKKIHFICVPLIFWSIAGLLWELPKISAMEQIAFLNWATVGLGLSLTFYLSLGIRPFFAMLTLTLTALGVCAMIEAAGWPLGLIAFVVFIGAWMGQFYGHKIEGKKPSLFDDLLFLLIGPLWTLSHFKLEK